MPDFHRHIEAAFAGTATDRDIVEELAQHAESTYAAASSRHDASREQIRSRFYAKSERRD